MSAPAPCSVLINSVLVSLSEDPIVAQLIPPPVPRLKMKLSIVDYQSIPLTTVEAKDYHTVDHLRNEVREKLPAYCSVRAHSCATFRAHLTSPYLALQNHKLKFFAAGRQIYENYELGSAST